jgi:16S rRNA (guanine527-N7)-methyltransferase
MSRGPSDVDLELQLAEALAELKLTLAPEPIARLVALAELVHFWNARRNLTGHQSTETIFQRLVLDALALWKTVDPLAGPGSIADLGSGAGFPGIPLAILAPERKVILVDARERRYHFQRTAVRELGLSNVEPRLGRIEALPAEPSACVVAQALAKPQQALEYAMRWLAPGGVVVIPGSETAPDPVDPDGQLAESGTAAYRVPLGGPLRTLWWGRVGAA